MLAAEKVELTDEQWRSILSEDEFYILRRSGTERAFTGRLLNNEDPGSYHCAGCGLYLYDAEHKFHSGCGWPSFNQEVAEGALTYYTDTSFGMVRKEMRCARCDGHLGHVFNDGPPPTGLRHCVNGGALIFVPEGADVAATLREHRAEYADK
jgi:peptide-methionine (R)-S-oxide reductase